MGKKTYADQGLYQAGIIVIDMMYWREAKASERFAQMLSQKPRFDMEVINSFFKNDVYLLEAKYSFCSVFELYGIELSAKIYSMPDWVKKHIAKSVNDVRIYHLNITDGLRPWQVAQNGVSADYPKRVDWDGYLAKTPFAGTAKQVKQMNTGLIKLRRLMQKFLPEFIYAKIHKLWWLRYMKKVGVWYEVDMEATDK